MTEKHKYVKHSLCREARQISNIYAALSYITSF